MADMSDLLSAVQNAVSAINTLNQTVSALNEAVGAAFPQADAAVTHSASAGSDALPADPAGFLTITVNGTSFKVPLYNS